jgi:CheY-like chemotaxis protein
MPRMDGWQFLERRQRNPSVAGIPVIVLSAEDRSVGSGVRRLGANDFLSKPVDPEVLLQVVGRYCGGLTDMLGGRSTRVQRSPLE